MWSLCSVNLFAKATMNAPLLCAVLLAIHSSQFVLGQTCSAPSQTNPMDPNLRGTSSLNTLYLYTDLFNSSGSPCTGELVQFDVCYQFNQNTGPRLTVFQLLLLEDQGTSYLIVASFEEQEDRGCVLTNSLCCKPLLPDTTVTVGANYAIMIIIPGTTGNNNLLAVSTQSSGYVTSIPINLATTTGGTILKSQLWLPDTPMLIDDRSLRAVIRPVPEETDAPATPEETDTTPALDPTVSVSTSTSTGPNQTPGVSPSGGNGGSIAAGVIVSLLVVIGVAVAGTVVALVLWKRSRNKYSPDRSTAGYDNKLYGQAGGSLIAMLPITKNTAVAATPTKKEEEEDIHEYEAPDMLNMPEEYEILHPAPSIRSHRGVSTMGGLLQGRMNPYGDTYSRGGSVGTANKGASLPASVNESAMLDSEIIYEDPATDENSLYAQYRRIDIKHIPRTAIQLQDHLGSGQFGTVQRGVWQSPSEGAVEVAVKTLKEGADDMDKVKFLQEAAIMGQFTHPSIVKLHGVAIFGEPKMIVLELLALGDLRKTLLALRPSEDGEVEQGLSHTLLSYCRQVASGMSYLAGMAFVHRDLAARNILISEDGDIKIADFGMSRDLLEENYYVSHGGKIPLRWTAPEAIHYKKYSAASDVWSFGAVMYEIWSLGHKPFGTYTNSEAISMVDSGVRLPPPPGCPRAIYALMIKCWHSAALERPDFPRIVQHLSLPDTKLLKWSAEDKGTHPEVASLGAELNVAVDLYKGLQNTYLTTKP